MMCLSGRVLAMLVNGLRFAKKESASFKEGSVFQNEIEKELVLRF